MTTPPEVSVLVEADIIINGERQKTYGPPYESFARIGRLWKPILGVGEISAEQVALCLIQLKVSRAVGGLEHSGVITRDTLVDIAGYAGCIELFGGRDG